MLRSLRWSLLLLLITAPAVGDPPKAQRETPRTMPWKLRIMLLAEIKAAPQFRYEVHQLTAYRDGVWADFTVFNLNEERMYLARQFLGTPVRSMEVRDAEDRDWLIAYFDGFRHFRDLDEFVEVRSQGAVRFRAKVSYGSDHKLLSPVDPPAPGKAGPRPKELTYSLSRWHTAYPRLPGRGVNTFVIGRGTVPVTWKDEKAPASLSWCERLPLK
jgi:hypothetical protein